MSEAGNTSGAYIVNRFDSETSSMTMYMAGAFWSMNRLMLVSGAI